MTARESIECVLALLSAPRCRFITAAGTDRSERLRFTGKVPCAEVGRNRRAIHDRSCRLGARLLDPAKRSKDRDPDHWHNQSQLDATQPELILDQHGQ